MRLSMLSRVLFVVPILLAVGLSQSSSSLAQTPVSGKVVIALKPDKNPDQMIDERKALTEYLGKALGRPVEVIIPLSSASILEGFRNGTIDLAYLSATDLINARQQGVGGALLAGEMDGKPYYASYWLTLKDKPYAKVEDLKGRKVAFSSKTSTSGFVIPLWDLHQRKLISASGNPEEFFGKGNVYYGSGYVSAVEKVLAGDAEAAAVSFYVLDKDKHLAPEQRARLKKLAEQGPVPTHLIATRKGLSASEAAQLKAALLGMNANNPELRDKVFTSKLSEVDEAKHLGALAETNALALKAVTGP
jgi:phosphonate transport system substrate-binding protein